MCLQWIGVRIGMVNIKNTQHNFCLLLPIRAQQQTATRERLELFCLLIATFLIQVAAASSVALGTSSVTVTDFVATNNHFTVQF